MCLTGPTDLTQYFVKHMDFLDSHGVDNSTGKNEQKKGEEEEEEGSNANSVYIVLVLGRKTLNEVLLTYLPTGGLHAACQNG